MVAARRVLALTIFCAGASAVAVTPFPDRPATNEFGEAARFAVLDICPAVMSEVIALAGNDALGEMGYSALSDETELSAARDGTTPQAVGRSDEDGKIQVFAYGQDQCDVLLSGPALPNALPKLASALEAEDSLFEKDEATPGLTYLGDPYGRGAVKLTLGPAYDAEIQPTIKASFVKTKD